MDSPTLLVPVGVYCSAILSDLMDDDEIKIVY